MPPHQLSTLKLLLPCSASPAPLLLQKKIASAFSLSFSRTLSSTLRCRLIHYPFIISSYSTPRGRRFPGGGGRRSGGGSAGGDRRGGNGGGSGGGRGGLFQQQRGSSTLRERRMIEEERTEGKEGDGFGFNKRRAEGRDKSAKPKELQLKNRKLNPVNTICYAQIMGTGMDTQDTSPSVLLFFDKQRFIFNAGEGMQRFCTEHKIKLSKIDHMFFTRVCSETAGGLPGLLLTLAGIGEEGMAVNIWGPSDLNYFVDAMRSFIPRSAMVHTHSFGVSQDDNEAVFSGSETGKSSNPIILVDDEVVRILAIPIKPNYQNGSSVKPGDIAVIYACELPEIKGKFDPVKAAALGLRPGPKYRELQLGKSVKSDLLDIMVNPNDVLGPSFPGPVMLLMDCPTHSHMLELLSSQSLNRYYCDCTNKLLDEKKVVSCIIHLGPASLTKSSDYQNWMKRFGDAQHIMAGHEIKNMEIPILKSSARIQSRLNYLCPQLFPVPGCWSSQHITNLSSQLTEPPEGSSTSYEGFSAANLLKFHLRPYSHLGLDRSIVPSTLTHEEIICELLSEIPEIVDAAKQINQIWANSMTSKPFKVSEGNSVGMNEEPWLNVNPVGVTVNTNMEKRRKVSSEDDMEKIWQDTPACLRNITREEMEIVLLGTGSSQPSKYRNVSSILINLFSRGSLLLDCGEGTLAQLKRRFGVKGADDVLKGLNCIWISHIHADHHAGLARILALRCQLLKDVKHEPVLVIGPRPLKRFLDAYSMLEDLDMQFLDCRHTLEASMNASLANDSGNECSTETQEKNSKIESTLFSQSSRMQRYWERPGSPVSIGAALPILKRLKETLTQAGLEALYSVPVVHCPQAFAVVLKAKERTNSTGKAIPGWKLVYSGDTRPCQALIDASLDATILIHEATFEESLKDEAIAKNHSTTMEAIGVGTSAGAYRVILTHFSQRYPKIPVFDEFDHKTCIAFDLMTVNLADLPVLPKFLPYLKLLFRNDMVIDESEDVQDSVLY